MKRKRKSQIKMMDRLACEGVGTWLTVLMTDLVHKV
jgi:hypothetical protein